MCFYSSFFIFHFCSIVLTTLLMLHIRLLTANKNFLLTYLSRSAASLVLYSISTRRPIRNCRAGNGSPKVTHRSPGPSPHTSASLTQIYRLPDTVFGHCICTHTPLRCYIIAVEHVSKLHIQAPVHFRVSA